MSIATALWAKIEAQLPATLQKARLLGMGIPVGKSSKVYFVDPVNGLDTNSGRSVENPLLTLAAAEDECVTGQNDTVVLLQSATSNALAASLTWDKSYTHLVGLSAPKAMGQRCRIGGSAALDLSTLITVSGSGCIFKNIHLQNGSDAAAIKSALVVSGSYNYFENIQASLTHATAASTSGSYAVGLTGSENTFVNCCIGNDTILHAGTNTVGVLSISGDASRNEFKKCRFIVYSETAGKFLVTDASAGRWHEYEDCIFQNFSANWATTLSNAFDLNAGAPTYNVILRGACQLVGITGWADVTTYVHTPGVNGAGTYGIDTAPTT